MCDKVEIADEFDPETGVGRGTGVAAAHAANMAMRLLTGGRYSHASLGDGMPGDVEFTADQIDVTPTTPWMQWDPRAQPWHDETGEQVWPRDDQ